MTGNKWHISEEIWEKMASLLPEHRTSVDNLSRRYEPYIQSKKEESEAIKSTDFKAHR